MADRSNRNGGRARRAVMACAVAAITGCWGGPPNPYPSDVVETFVTSCTAKAPKSVCRCSIDRIQRAFTLDQFRAFEDRLAQGDMPKELVDAVADCQGR